MRRHFALVLATCLLASAAPAPRTPGLVRPAVSEGSGGVRAEGLDAFESALQEAEPFEGQKGPVRDPWAGLAGAVQIGVHLPVQPTDHPPHPVLVPLGEDYAQPFFDDPVVVGLGFAEEEHDIEKVRVVAVREAET